uniref:Uncharacterized protein n=1 Tax=Periophthalmus magnuspinnatus TaxID=409849 RepID=A0A3B4AIB8_9GOBI
STKEVKSALKSARDAIKNKEFKEALKHCKAVLKIEKNNYNAWVFIGLSATELEQPDQAQMAYKKAVELEPDQLLAWQGLANLYEKVDQWDFKVDLPSVYEKLVELDRNKCYETIKKLSEIYESDKEYLKLAQIWTQHIRLKEEDGVDKKELLQLWQQMSQLLTIHLSELEPNDETQQHLITAFEKALVLVDPAPGEEHKRASVDLINCLSKVFSDDAIRCFTLLQDKNPDSGLAWLGLGTKALSDGKYKDAISHLDKGWFCLGQAYLKMHRYSDCVASCSNLATCKFESEELMTNLLKLKVEALVRCGGEKAADEALEIFSVSDAEKDPSLISLQGRAFLNKGQVEKGLKFLEAADQNPDCGEYYFLLGQLYWNMGVETRKEKSKAHTQLLKAAKLDPNLDCAFRYLGHYYRDVANDYNRARGCYKKAFELNNNDAESGAASVDLCMEQGHMDMALEVLQSVILKATPGSAKWAWMRRGLYYLKAGQHQQAIALQAALRADPEDWVCWECLGEAYLNRRSFTAALKAFTKAQQLQPSSIYSVYQAAAIKQTLGKFKEAAAEYIQITAQHDYVPALKAVKLRPDLSCLWKLLGDACTAVSTVSPNKAQVLMPALLCGSNNEQNQMLDQSQTIKVGECYAHALKLMPDVPSLWHDLGLNYHKQARLFPSTKEDESQTQVLDKAQQCLKKAIMMDSGNHIYWNALGMVSVCKIENFALAQHCFIKSIQAEQNNVVAWTNLGALYLKKDNIELAHEAFKIAQSLEPLYVYCWIGQAMIAEKVGSYDTMDLFRHTTELSTHMEGVKGYAHWVCSTLLDKSNRDSELYRYNIVQMNAVSAAQVALSKYTRVQSDPEAFIMLGFLNEHLHLKRQALQAYQEMHTFVLRNYGRALSSGQWEEAVQVLKSTPLEELTDLVCLALAYCRAGLIPESVNYERALAVASNEKEKAYILTALALLQNLQGNIDSAKTLLFKSLLKEPIPESLLCLCAVGLVQNDTTLAAAALAELLKQTSNSETVVEQHCLLTCTLLALQGNFSAVQREASRAIHNPGNPALWTFLSRLVPQYFPKKANGGAMAGHVACLSSMTHGKRALLHSGVNQLASGQHSGDDNRSNALKTMQRAVLLCPDAAAWAGLMAACHTENTACYLSGSAPRGTGLEQIFMAVVSEKPLAQMLEAWVLQQSVTGLVSRGELEQAEALCSQVLSVSPEHPAVLLSLRQVQCQHLLLANEATVLPDAIIEQLNMAVAMNPTNISAWHWLAEVYHKQGLLLQAVMTYKQSLQMASQFGLQNSQVASLLRLGLLALRMCMDWKDLVQEATNETLKFGPSPMALLFQALLQFSIKMTADTRRFLEKLVYVSQDAPITVVQVASWYLLRHLHGKNDEEVIK